MNGASGRMPPEVEESFARAFEPAAIGMALADFEGRFLRVNRALCDLVGRTESELTSTSWQAITHPEDVGAGEDLVRRALEGEMRTFVLEKRYLRPDGSVVWVLLNVSIVRDALERPICLFTQVNDLTARKHAEDALRRAHEALLAREQRARSIIETAREAFVEIDRRGWITGWNRQAELTFGWTRDGALGRRLEETIVPPQYREAHRRGLERCLETGEPRMLSRRVELSALHRDGREFPIEMVIWPLVEKGEQRFCALILDITERKRAEMALQEQSRRLQVRAQQLEELDRAHARLFGVLTHELMHPAASIRALALTLGRRWSGLSEAERLELVGRLERESARLRTLAEEAAGATFLETDAFSLAVRPERVGDVVREAAGASEDLRERLVVRVDEDAGSVVVAADRARVLQVFRNLFSNAAKYAGTEQPVILDVEAVPGEVVFRVADSGPGIPPEAVPRLFQPFSRGDGRALGSGLGLYISRRIVEAHGGRIWVETQAGEGASFAFTLPRVE